MKFHLSVLSAISKVNFTGCVFYLIFFTTQITAHNAKIPALFAFGDSILDTGNNNNLNTISKCNWAPYGKDFPEDVPTGRFGNGKVFSDLLAEGLGIKSSVPAYFDPNLKSSDLTTGVCFASGGSGLDELTAVVQNIVSRTNQSNNFKEYIQKLQQVVGTGQTKGIISDSLFLISACNNDIAINYYILRLRSQYDIDSYTTLLVNWTTTWIKDLHGLGARRFAVMSTLPLGCLPGIRTIFEGIFRACSENINQAAILFNTKLENEINNLKRTLPGAKLVFIDVYNPLLKIIQHPQESGFIDVVRGCCGSGLLETAFLCTKWTPTCQNTSSFAFWDSVHPSEATYRMIVSEVLKKYGSSF